MSKEYGGWTGEILRVDLTGKTFSTIDTFKYVPKYVGGLGVAHGIWWDEVGPGVKAFDPENKLIIMNGPATGTASPCGGRGEVVSISPHCYPEMYTNTGIGGGVPTNLKWHGYDGLVIQGKAEGPCYILISDKGPEIIPCPELWGLGLIDAQDILRKRHGDDVSCYGIGPAGEHLVRYAILGCGAHNATGQSGMGAVAGSKNLKAICVTAGKHQVKVADPDALMESALKFAPKKRHRPYVGESLGDKQANPFWPAWVGKDEKPNFAINWMGLVYNKPHEFICHSCTFGCMNACGFYEFKDVPNVTHPGLNNGMTGCIHTRFEQFFHKEEGEDNFAKGFEIHVMSQQLGFGAHELVYGIVPWLHYTKQLGIDTESLMGMETDIRSNEWWLKLLHMIAYREGFGDQLAEGLRRTVVELGEEKYADPIYEGEEAARSSSWPTVKLPVAALGGWGYVSRGHMAEMAHPSYMPSLLNWLIDTRDPHHNKWPDWAHNEFYKFCVSEDPYTDPFGPKWAKVSTLRGTLIDCLTTCWLFPLRKYMGWEYDYDLGEDTGTTSAESEFFAAVTGVKLTEEEYMKAGERVNTLFRAIQMRNHGRTAQMEWDELIPRMYFRLPDPERFKITVGNFYELLGWDRETGWPTREHLESHDMHDVLNQLDSLGLLPQAK